MASQHRPDAQENDILLKSTPTRIDRTDDPLSLRGIEHLRWYLLVNGFSEDGTVVIEPKKITQLVQLIDDGLHRPGLYRFQQLHMVPQILHPLTPVME